MSKSTTATLPDGTRVTVPDDQFDALPEGFEARAFRGVRFTRGVFCPEGQCRGWILVDDLEGKV